MSDPSDNRPHVDIDRDHVLDDDLPVEPDVSEDPDVPTPEHHELPVEVPEADAVDQETDVPLDDDDRR